MKTMKFSAVFAIFALIFSNGCLSFTFEKEVKEPTINKEPEKAELVVENIEVIEQQDTTGRVSAAKEAAAKLITDAKQRAKDLTRDAENIYDIKKHEAEANAEKIIAEAKKQAEKERKAILAKKAPKKAVAVKKVKAVPVKKTKKACVKGEKVARKVIFNAKKSAADITKASYKHMEKAKKDADNLISKANNYAKATRKKADEYLTKKMAEADKAVADFTKKMEKDMKGSATPKSEEEIKAQRIVKRLLDSIPKNDYETFSKDFTVDLKKRFTKEKFLQTNKTLDEKLGKVSKLTYLGFIKKGPLTVYMWKANFAKTKKENEMMVRLTLGELDKRLQIFAFDIAIL